MFTDTTPCTVAVVDHGSSFRAEVRRALAGFLAGYSGTAVEAYRLDLRQWLAWLDSFHTDVFAVERAHIELYARVAEAEGKARATIARSAVDYLWVLPVLHPRTADWSQPGRACAAAQARLRIHHAGSGSQRARSLPGPSRAGRGPRSRAGVSVGVERVEDLRGTQRRHRRPRCHPRPPHLVHSSQGQQDRHHPAVTTNGSSYRSLHRRTGAWSDLLEPRQQAPPRSSRRSSDRSPVGQGRRDR